MSDPTATFHAFMASMRARQNLTDAGLELLVKRVEELEEQLKVPIEPSLKEIARKCLERQQQVNAVGVVSVPHEGPCNVVRMARLEGDDA